MAELEDELVAAKADAKVKPDKLKAIKEQVRAARQAYREAREG
jgi:hypothetical protein